MKSHALLECIISTSDSTDAGHLRDGINTWSCMLYSPWILPGQRDAARCCKHGDPIDRFFPCNIADMLAAARVFDGTGRELVREANENEVMSLLTDTPWGFDEKLSTPADASSTLYDRYSQKNPDASGRSRIRGSTLRVVERTLTRSRQGVSCLSAFGLAFCNPPRLGRPSFS